MNDFLRLKKNLKQDFSSCRPVRVALLGDSATQFLCQAVRGAGYEAGLDLQIFESDYNQIDYQVFNASSALYQYNPEVVIIFQSTQKLLNKYDKLGDAELTNGFADAHLEHVQEMINQLNSRLSSRIIYYNFPEIDDAVFGSYANKVFGSFLFQLRRLNCKLMELAMKEPNLYIADLSTIQNTIGRERFFHPSVYINTDMVLSIDALPWVAYRTTDIIGALYGNSKKCLILDLDNTLWGGVIGDDGMENIQIGNLGIGKAFTEFQYWIKKLKNRGIILAVCSKNTEEVAKEPFEKHPDMVLRLGDIAVFMANWDNKPDNIRTIQSILNIGFDSMVFLDDNPFERNMVRENIPGIAVPELPEDPAEYLPFLYSQNLFETVTYTNLDSDRTKQYQTEAERVVQKFKFTNENEYLQSLGMEAEVTPFNAYNIPRVAQLIQRSNQFNLRTIRYSEAEVSALSQSNDHYTWAYSLRDKYGDNGLIAGVILKKENPDTLFIDTWLMSCRVLKRGMEDFIVNHLVGAAREKHFKALKGEYLPTAKNGLVKDLLGNSGFTYRDGYWYLDVTDYQNKEVFITEKQI
jgi:HAD-superfamily phosphatase, subfamily IIIC/FkbH-like domain